MTSATSTGCSASNTTSAIRRAAGSVAVACSRSARFTHSRSAGSIAQLSTRRNWPRVIDHVDGAPVGHPRQEPSEETAQAAIEMHRVGQSIHGVRQHRELLADPFCVASSSALSFEEVRSFALGAAQFGDIGEDHAELAEALLGIDHRIEARPPAACAGTIRGATLSSTSRIASCTFEHILQVAPDLQTRAAGRLHPPNGPDARRSEGRSARPARR